MRIFLTMPNASRAVKEVGHQDGVDALHGLRPG